ncbi:MAG: VWA domain-containing protein [Dehalococcoidia bacterium]|nr:VWA domain-containing protein [Dehalococcoidia bacterium]
MNESAGNREQPKQETANNYFGIEFSSIEPVMQFYCTALTGREVEISTGSNPPTTLRNTWWKQLCSGHTPNGHVRVFVPVSFMNYPDYADNFGWYKSVVTQQIGHAEFGSFDFDYDKDSLLFDNLRSGMQPDQGSSESSYQRFISLFDDRLLAAHIFVAAENIRTNYLVKYYYPGLKHHYRRMQEDILVALSQLPGMTLRRAFYELLEGLEFDAVLTESLDVLYTPLSDAWEVLGRLCSPSATVEDSTEAAIRLYDIAKKLPKNLFVSSALSYIPGTGEPDFSDEDGQEFEGDFDADEMKLDMEMRPRSGQKATMPMIAEDLKKLDGQKINITDIQNSQSLPSTGLSAADLPRGVHIYQFSQAKYQQVDQYRPDDTISPVKPEDDEKLFRYDEWDFRARRYMGEWCCIREKVLSEGSSYFYEKTLESRKSLAAELKRQFEKLPAELLYKAKNLDDGDEYDLDLVIGELIDKKAGRTPSGKVYWKKKKIKRDVAVAFLLDMSGSTSDLINKSRTPMEYDESIKYDFMKFVMQPRRRIIDLEKESIVLLMHAIETLGDNYGIYGFSGHGRSKVQFLVIKDFSESISEKIKRRVDNIAPIHGTRMGPAIRHATSKLDAFGSSLKLLFLVSDGYPQDSMYGYDDDDKEYAIHDTKMALLEATRKNITPFCLTVDSAGNDYLRTMCDDIGYEVLDDIEMLPHRLPMLYRKLSV